GVSRVGSGPAAWREAPAVASPGAASSAGAYPGEAFPVAYSGDSPAVGTVGADTADPLPGLPGMAHPDMGRPDIPAAAGSPRRAPVACRAGRQLASPGAAAPGTGRAPLVAGRLAFAPAPAAGRAGLRARSAAVGPAGCRGRMVPG